VFGLCVPYGWRPGCAYLYPPSRIIVGEVRQREALDLLIPLNSGLPGMASIHANSAREAITKICTLPLLTRENIGSRFVVSTVAGCVDLVVHIFADHDRDHGAYARLPGCRDVLSRTSWRWRRSSIGGVADWCVPTAIHRMWSGSKLAGYAVSNLLGDGLDEEL
jgi:hypothetical protein